MVLTQIDYEKYFKAYAKVEYSFYNSKIPVQYQSGTFNSVGEIPHLSFAGT